MYVYGADGCCRGNYGEVASLFANRLLTNPGGASAIAVCSHEPRLRSGQRANPNQGQDRVWKEGRLFRGARRNLPLAYFRSALH